MNIHLLSKDIAKIYKEELYVPYLITYPISFIFFSILCLGLMIKNGFKRTGTNNQGNK